MFNPEILNNPNPEKKDLEGKIEPSSFCYSETGNNCKVTGP